MDGQSEYLAGERLFGDDFDADAIARWYSEEELGYYGLASSHSGYSYHALNHYHFFRHLRGHFGRCLAFGCASGEDVEPISHRVSHFVAVEPAESWWKSDIGGTPATYLKPAVDGTLPVEGGSIDLICCFGVLHHIPNVSHVLAEFARVLAPGGLLLLREPVSSMGKWWEPRLGCTRNERGLPPQWLSGQLRELGLDVVRQSWTAFPLVSLAARALSIGTPYNRPGIVRLDAALAKLTSRNMHYFRDNKLKKIAPGSVAYILQRPASE